MSEITSMIYKDSAKVEDFDISVGARSGFCASWCEVGGPARNVWIQCRIVALSEIPREETFKSGW